MNHEFVWEDRDATIEMIKLIPFIYVFAPLQIREDREIFDIACKKSESIYRYASNNIRRGIDMKNFLNDVEDEILLQSDEDNALRYLSRYRERYVFDPEFGRDIKRHQNNINFIIKLNFNNFVDRDFLTKEIIENPLYKYINFICHGKEIDKKCITRNNHVKIMRIVNQTQINSGYNSDNYFNLIKMNFTDYKINILICNRFKTFKEVLFRF